MLVWLIGLLVVALVGALLIRFGINPRTAPVAKGVTAEGLLHPCPGTPNCVSSTSTASDGYIEPLVLTGGNSLDTVLAALPSVGNYNIEQSGDQYAHVVFMTPMMGYRDDVEFARDPANGNRIQVRSASRLGKSDLGANRQRIERLRALLAPEGR